MHPEILLCQRQACSIMLNVLCFFFTPSISHSRSEDESLAFNNRACFRKSRFMDECDIHYSIEFYKGFHAATLANTRMISSPSSPELIIASLSFKNLAIGAIVAKMRPFLYDKFSTTLVSHALLDLRSEVQLFYR